MMIRIQLRDHEQPSPGVIDPYMRLCAAIAKRGVKDLGDSDPVTALDALDWLICDAPPLLRLLGFDIGNDDVFLKAVQYAI